LLLFLPVFRKGFGFLGAAESLEASPGSFQVSPMDGPGKGVVIPPKGKGKMAGQEVDGCLGMIKTFSLEKGLAFSKMDLTVVEGRLAFWNLTNILLLNHGSNSVCSSFFQYP